MYATREGTQSESFEEERNLLTKHRFSGYVSATRGGTPSNSFEGSINLLVNNDLAEVFLNTEEGLHQGLLNNFK